MAMKKLFSEIGILLWGAFACLGIFPPAFAQRPSVRPVNQVIIVDSTGKIVGSTSGNLVEPTLVPRVLLKMNDRLFTIGVGKHRLFGSVNIFYESAGCLGTPHFPTDSPVGSLLPMGALVPPGNTVYVPQQGAVSKQISFQSVFLREGGCTPHTTSIEAVPGESLGIDMDTVFTPPFSIRTIP